MSEAQARALEREIYGQADHHRDVRATAAEAADAKRERVVAEWAPQLRAAGYQVGVRNGGLLMVVQAGGRKFDIWPGTERWRERDNGIDRARMAWNRPARRTGNGLQDLLRAMAEA